MKKYSIVLLAVCSITCFGMNRGHDKRGAHTSKSLVLDPIYKEVMDSEYPIQTMLKIANKMDDTIVLASCRAHDFKLMQLMLGCMPPEQRGELLVRLVAQEGSNFSKIPNEELPDIIRHFCPYRINKDCVKKATKEEERSTDNFDVLNELDMLNSKPFKVSAPASSTISNKPLINQNDPRIIKLSISKLKYDNKENSGPDYSHIECFSPEHAYNWDKQARELKGRTLVEQSKNAQQVKFFE